MKIDIIGSVASGKTTLATALSSKYHVPCYQKDNIVWERTVSGDVKRSESSRDKIFMDILDTDNWIVEGSPRKCLTKSYECCDYIIFLDTATAIRLKRVITRWLRQRAGKEPYNSKPTLSFFIQNIKWVFEFNRDREKIVSTLSKYGKKYKCFKNQQTAMDFISRIYE